MTSLQLAALHAAFRVLQPEIREWLTSDEAMEAIGAVGERLVLSREQKIQLPVLILRLVTQDISPESFKSEIAQALSVAPDIAAQATTMLAETVFAPVAQALRFSGIDTTALGFDSPAAPPAAQTIAPDSNFPTFPKKETQSPPSPPSFGEQEIKPFILHKEPKTEQAEAPRPSFSFISESSGAFGESAPAPKVIIERVVHYSNLRSSLTEPRRPRAEPKMEAIRKPSSRWFV